jgi:hypothetical protein
VTWEDCLDHIDQVGARIQLAVAAGDATAIAEAATSLGFDRSGFPPMPGQLGDRARQAIERLASLDATIRRAMARLEPELSLLERVRPADAAPQYVDTSA